MTIPNRDEQHGGLEAVGGVSRRIKDIMQLSGRNWHRLTPGEQEALDIIAHKIGRILSGADPHDPEHWRDVAGYAMAARRGDGPEAAPEAEQAVNQWRNDRGPGDGDGCGGCVWAWCNDKPCLTPIDSVRAWWNTDPTNRYWAPGHLPAPPHPPQP